MAGRFQAALDWAELLSIYGLAAGAEPPERWRGPKYNVLPRQAVTVVLRDPEPGSTKPIAQAMRWGFPPMWVKKRGKEPFNEPPLINAKSETAPDKPTWRKALAERRCLVPTTGLHEWVKQDGDRRPLLFRRKDGAPLTLAGLWGRFDWGDKKGWPCMSILTTEPNATLRAVHNRMPAVLPHDPDVWSTWLDPDSPMETVTALLHPAPDDLLEAVEVSSRLNSIKSEDPELMQADWTWTDRP